MGEDGTNQYAGNSNEGTYEDGTEMTELIPDTQDTGQGYVNYYEQSQGMMGLIFVLVIICAIINIIYRLTLPPINWWGSYIRRLPDYSKANQTNLFL
jgi:hypothetical protein